jgi:hypothetical protein
MINLVVHGAKLVANPQFSGVQLGLDELKKRKENKHIIRRVVYQGLCVESLFGRPSFRVNFLPLGDGICSFGGRIGQVGGSSPRSCLHQCTLDSDHRFAKSRWWQ